MFKSLPFKIVTKRIKKQAADYDKNIDKLILYIICIFVMISFLMNNKIVSLYFKAF